MAEEPTENQGSQAAQDSKQQQQHQEATNQQGEAGRFSIEADQQLGGSSDEHMCHADQHQPYLPEQRTSMSHEGRGKEGGMGFAWHASTDAATATTGSSRRWWQRWSISMGQTAQTQPETAGLPTGIASLPTVAAAGGLYGQVEDQELHRAESGLRQGGGAAGSDAGSISSSSGETLGVRGRLQTRSSGGRGASHSAVKGRDSSWHATAADKEKNLDGDVGGSMEENHLWLTWLRLCGASLLRTKSSTSSSSSSRSGGWWRRKGTGAGGEGVQRRDSARSAASTRSGRGAGGRGGEGGRDAAPTAAEIARMRDAVAVKTLSAVTRRYAHMSEAEEALQLKRARRFAKGLFLNVRADSSR